MVYGVSFAGWLVYVLPERADRFVIPLHCKKNDHEGSKVAKPKGKHMPS